MNSFADLRGMPHHFLRYAANVDAGAAQLFGFNQCAFLAVHCRTVNGGNTAAAAADSDVIIVLGHDRSFMFIVGRRSVMPSAKIFAIVYLKLKGSTDGCDYSGTIQLTEVCPVPAGTSLLCSHGRTLFICCSSFHGGLITIMPDAVIPR